MVVRIIPSLTEAGKSDLIVTDGSNSITISGCNSPDHAFEILALNGSLILEQLKNQPPIVS